MPIYEYECEKCGAIVEMIHGMSEKPPTSRCAKCKGKLQRLISAAAFHLKGGGWYKDLYSSAKPGASSDSSASGSGESATSTPAATPPATPAKAAKTKKKSGGSDD